VHAAGEDILSEKETASEAVAASPVASSPRSSDMLQALLRITYHSAFLLPIRLLNSMIKDKSKIIIPKQQEGLIRGQ
jgi:hypothetical protein